MSIIEHGRALYEWYRALRTLRRIMATLASAAIVLLPLGCADPAPTGASPAQARLTITNVADHGAWYVRSRRCGTTRWGGDLAQNTVIPVGMSRTFGLAPGCVEVRVETTSALGGSMEWTARTLEPGQVDTLRLEQWTFN